jgi:hypothetical protein
MMTVYYIRLDTEKREIKFKRGFFGVWWYGGIFSLFLLGRDGWPCVNWHFSSVPKKRDGEWHVDPMHIDECPEAREYHAIPKRDDES